MIAVKTHKRIINVSNRLPVKVNICGDQVNYFSSDGGLATALSSLFKENEHIWIGWPGAQVPEGNRGQVSQDLYQQDLIPVYLSKQEINYYYEGFSNGAIWPLFHYFSAYSVYEPEQWDYYVSVNQKFAEEILKHATPDDIIWIHDYQLMLVPDMIRKALPDVTIGYFHHIPFPSYEVYRALPWKKEIIQGLLGADTIGFQTNEDADYFKHSAVKLLSCTSAGNEIKFGSRSALVDAFPISIDYDRFKALTSHTETKKHEARIDKLVGTQLIVSIDRLDYSKGILQRLQAYDLFLQRYPEYIQKVTLVHLIVPSRDTVCQYRELKQEMNKLISEINGKYATIGWQPIHNFYKSFPPNLLSALYKKADVALVTPIRDGMNLVCKEYVASKVDLNGVLVLSESAGAAHELKEAIQINPNDIEAFSNAIFQALNMPEYEKRQRMLSMQVHIKKENVFTWAKRFFDTLALQQEASSTNIGQALNEMETEQIAIQYAESNQRLIVLDYDGTLVSLKAEPKDASPDQSLLRLLTTLTNDVNNKVVVISGRDRFSLENWLGQLPVDIIAEHGVFYKEQKQKWLGVAGLDQNWKNSLRKTLLQFVDQVPGSFIEEKTHTLALHYRTANPELVKQQLPVLTEKLELGIRYQELNILKGKKVIEIKSSLVDKGKAVEALLKKNNYNFILAAGDDITDEDMFNYLPKSAVTIKVGSNISAARLFVSSPQELRLLLKKLIAISKHAEEMSLIK